MSYSTDYLTIDPTRAEVGAMAGATLLEFGNPWCGHCRRAISAIRQALDTHPNVRHIKIADASGKRLGRSFHVKLWPTLIFLKDGAEITRLVRPASVQDIEKALGTVEA